MAEQTKVQQGLATDNSQSQDSDDLYVDNSIVVLGPILEAESKHGPVFRRQLFDAAYTVYLSLQTNDQEAGQVEEDTSKRKVLDDDVTLLDIYGKEAKVPVMRAGHRVEHNGIPHVSKRIWLYNCIQSLGHNYGGHYGGGNTDTLCPYNFGARYVEVEAKDCFKEEAITAKAQVWAEEWTKSEMYSRVTAILEKHAGRTMQHVDKIICFGLGCFTTEWEHAAQRSYIQHLAACTVRDIIAQQQGGAIPKMYTQEPIYCTAAITHITKHFNMTVLDDPEGFKALDGNSFVISFACNVPVRQIAFGLTHEFGGPAGLFCDDILSEGLECDGKGCKDRDDGRQACPYKTCEPSPGLWRYKQESIWTEYGDRSGVDWFGNVGLYLKRR